MVIAFSDIFYAPFDGSEELRVPIGRFPTNPNAPFRSPTNRKVPFDGFEELRVPIGRTIRTFRSAVRPIGRLLLTVPKNSASRLVGSRPIETLRAKKQTDTHTNSLTYLGYYYIDIYMYIYFYVHIHTLFKGS